MTLLIFLAVIIIICIQAYVAIKLKSRFSDLDRRLEKIDTYNFEQKISSKLLLNQVQESSWEIQNTACLSASGFNYPVFFGGWSIDSFLAKFLATHLLENKPGTIVEIGSGSSSILIAQCTKKIGYTPKHIAIDHEHRYLELTKKTAALNGVEKRIEFHECPLKEIDIPGHKGAWYHDVLNSIDSNKIDLLIIDGPPEQTCAFARYPALPMLYSQLSEECTIILDDSSRDDEKNIIKKWMELYPEFEATFITEGHGVTILTRTKNPA